MHIKHITSTVLLSLASASVILAAPTTNKRAAESDILCPIDGIGGDCADFPSLSPREETEKEKLVKSREDDGGDQFCLGRACPPPEEETKKEKRAEKFCIPHCVGEHCQCEEEEQA